MSEVRRVDFFVSYTATDVAWAEWAAFVLEEAGFTTVLQAWDFLPGSNFVLGMDDALRRSDRVLALLSEPYLRSVFAAPEWAAAFASDQGWEGRLLPVRVGECQPEGLLRAVVHVDLVGLEGEEAKRRLLAGATGGRAKPALAPYPGAKRPAPDPQPFPGAPSPGPVVAGRRAGVWRRVLALGAAVALIGGIATIVADGDDPATRGGDLVNVTFDALPIGTIGSNGRIRDTDTGPGATVRAEFGGRIAVVARSAGDNAIKFPDPCPPGPVGECPRAIVQTADPSSFDAGAGDFAYGADVLVRPSEVSPGAAILHKGRVTQDNDSELMLRLESDGNVSCVAVVPSHEPVAATSTVAVADGGWHRVTCTRTGSELRINLDGGGIGVAPLDAGVRFESDAPLRLGGTSGQQDNAQFSGSLDNVFFRLGAT